MNAAVRRLAIGAGLVASGLAVTARPASAQVADQQIVATEQATVNFDLPSTSPTLSWVAPTNTPRARFADAAVAPRQSVSSGVGVGALVGWTRTSTRDDAGAEFEDAFDFDSRSGWMAGIWFGGNRDGVVGFMGEVSYVVKKVADGSDDGVVTELGYIEIPALLRINIGQRRTNGFLAYGLVGPVFDFKVSDNQDDIDPDGEIDGDLFESFDIGLMVGAGFEVARIGFEVRGNWGLRSVASTDFTEGVNIKTFTLQMVGKIRFN